MPNVQIDGTLNVQGTVFIPTGTTTSKVIPRVTSTDNAVVRFDGVTGDVQNSSVIINDSGNVGIGLTNPGDRLAVKGNAAITSLIGTTASDGSGVLFYRGSDNSQMAYVGFGSGGTPFEFVNSKNNGFNFYNGEILQKTAYGLGYGLGSGGAVTQATNKNFNVTLNKPTGTITTSNSTLAAGQGVSFSFLNSLIGANDNLKLTPKGTINYDIDVIDIYNGAAVIRIINKDTISHSDVIAINFAILKGANS